MRATLLLFASRALFAIDTTSRHAPLEYPPEIRSSNGGVNVTLDFAEFIYSGPGMKQRTRVYNGAMVGPTIRVKQGDTVRITVNNRLPAEQFDTSQIRNGLRDFSRTNLHTHGLHVSSAPPQDDIFTEIVPGSHFSYLYSIPDDHMGGLHWYHPHHHGSTAIQTGSAFGALIVEDPPGSLPPQIESLAEVLLLCHHFNMPALQALAHEYERNCLALGGRQGECRSLFGPGAMEGNQTNAVLVNGMTNPVLSISANRWYRFRILFAAVDDAIFPEMSTCEVSLLAKDGIYLHQAPRAIGRAFMGPGTRSDWLVRCSEGVHTLQLHDAAEGYLKVVAANQGDSLCSLGEFRVKRPCYLVDLSGTTGTPPPKIAKTSSVSFGENLVDGQAFRADSVLDTFEVGKANELNPARNVDKHSLHLHVNALQIAEEPFETYHNYFRAGDWQDTLLSPNSELKVRFNTDRFTGAMVVHCHRLEHEDKGMMGIYQVAGSEGTRFDGASIDSTCYSGYFSEIAHKPEMIRAGTCAYVPIPRSASQSAPPVAPPPPPYPPLPPDVPYIMEPRNAKTGLYTVMDALYSIDVGDHHEALIIVVVACGLVASIFVAFSLMYVRLNTSKRKAKGSTCTPIESSMAPATVMATQYKLIRPRERMGWC